MTKIKISNKELTTLLGIRVPEFPKYVTQLINLANQNAQGTRPKIVGQMSELVEKSGSRSIREWEDWYTKHYPGAIERASDKVWDMVALLKNAIEQIDKEMVEKWIEDLVIVKTFLGLRFQEAILRKVAEIAGQQFRLSSPDEESKGIDGWIGEIPISVKPDTYEVKKGLPEQITIEMIYYSKKKDGIYIMIENIQNLRRGNI